jgi:hypothetical protein
MTPEVSEKASGFPATRSSVKINTFFDNAELIVARSDRLLSKSKPALINLFLFLHLAVDLIVFLALLLWKFG